MNIEKLYDLIYDRADKLFKEYNPCNIHKNKDGYTNCLEYKGFANQLCCLYCHGQYWDNGCTVQCLKCKLFICISIECVSMGCKNHPNIKLSKQQLKELKVFVKKIKQLQKLWRKIQERYKLPFIQFYWSKKEYINLVKGRYEKSHTIRASISV